MYAIRSYYAKHNLTVLLHEKPFARVNGSGKHNNWSLSTDKGQNLLAPGKNEKENIRFLTFFVITSYSIHYTKLYEIVTG